MHTGNSTPQNDSRDCCIKGLSKSTQNRPTEQSHKEATNLIAYLPANAKHKLNFYTQQHTKWMSVCPLALSDASSLRRLQVSHIQLSTKSRLVLQKHCSFCSFAAKKRCCSFQGSYCFCTGSKGTQTIRKLVTQYRPAWANVNDSKEMRLAKLCTTADTNTVFLELLCTWICL